MQNTPPDFNPYAASSTTPVGFTPQDTSLNVESVRRYHLNHEASVKSIGFLYGLGAVFGLIAIPVELVALLQTNNRGMLSTSELSIAILIVAMFAVLSVIQGIAAWNLRKLNPIGRVLGTIIATIGLIWIPIGTIISLYILYLFWSKKGSMVFSPEYKQVIAQTPHIKYKTSIFVWLLLGLLLLLLGLILVAAFTARR